MVVQSDLKRVDQLAPKMVESLAGRMVESLAVTWEPTKEELKVGWLEQLWVAALAASLERWMVAGSVAETAELKVDVKGSSLADH